VNFKGTHILSSKQFSRKDLELLFSWAARMPRIATRNVRCEVLKGYKLLELFFEPSTRTMLSHATAFERLGGSVNTVQNVSFSSMSKGETFEDTVRVMSAYCDVMVIRTKEVGEVKRAADCLDRALDLLKKPVIVNAGDGAGEHPTQALLDLYSIYAEKGRVDGLTIALEGDLKHSRTVHSLVRLLALFKGVKLKLVSPEELILPPKLKAFLAKKRVPFSEIHDLGKGVKGCDVVYMTRVQQERFADPKQYERVKDRFVLTRRLVDRKCKKSVTILHPLPRVNEITLDVDSHPGAAYFRQSDRGVELRMALFLLILGKEHKFV
jgi:aspartate carbamoyltransferase